MSGSEVAERGNKSIIEGFWSFFCFQCHVVNLGIYNDIVINKLFQIVSQKKLCDIRLLLIVCRFFVAIDNFITRQIG